MKTSMELCSALLVSLLLLVQCGESASPIETEDEGRLFTMELQQLVKQQQQLDGPQDVDNVAAPSANKNVAPALPDVFNFRQKKSFHLLQCRGSFQKKIFSKLDRVCDDCYSLFKIPEVHALCRSDCFKSVYFSSCVDALMLKEKRDLYDEMVSILGK